MFGYLVTSSVSECERLGSMTVANVINISQLVSRSCCPGFESLLGTSSMILSLSKKNLKMRTSYNIKKHVTMIIYN